MACHEGISKDAGKNIRMPFDFFPHFTAFLILLLSTYLQSLHPCDEFHLIRNKTVGKQRHSIIKKNSTA